MLVAERDVWVAGRGAAIANGTLPVVTSHAADVPSAVSPPSQQPTLAWLTAAEVEKALGRGPREGPQPPLLLGETGGEGGDGGGTSGGSGGGLRFAISVEREEPASLRTLAVKRGSLPLFTIRSWRPCGWSLHSMFDSTSVVRTSLQCIPGKGRVLHQSPPAHPKLAS